MARRHDYVPPELNTRYGSSDNYDEQAGDMTDDWLSMNDPSIATERAINGNLEGEDLNGLSSAGMMEHRVKSMPQGVQAATKAIFGGQLGTLQSRIAAENYLNLTGEDPAAFARRIKAQTGGNVSITDEYGNTRTQTPSAYSKSDLRIAQGMFSEEGIDKYMSRGVGSAQEGNTYGIATLESAYRDSLKNAYATVRAIAPRVIDPLVPAGAGYETRLLQAEEELIKFGMESVGGERDVEGNYVGGNRQRMPNPNELRVRGRRSTIGRATGTQGTPFTQLEYDAAVSPGGSLYGNEEAYRYIPSGYKSYGLEKDEFYEMQKEYLAAMKTIRQSTLTATDEAYGNTQRNSGYQQSREDWNAIADMQNEAYIQDIDRNPNFVAGGGMGQGGTGEEQVILEKISDENAGFSQNRFMDPEYASRYGQSGIAGGSEKGGMYGISEASDYTKFAEDYKIDDSVDPFSERGEYIARMRGAPTQGSAQWLAQRKQVDFTASTIGILGSGSGTNKLAINLRLRKKDAIGVTEGYDYKGDYQKDISFIGNTYTKEGNVFEGDVRRFFMAQVGEPAGLQYQEAFFERGKGSLANFGVTPDARLYDAEGKSAGLAEFKLKRGDAFNTVLEDYYDQVQLQMAVTGESKTHLFALNQHTDETKHHLVEADPVRQEFLIAQANEAKAQAEGLTLKDTDTLMKTIKGRNAAKDKGVPTTAGEEARLQTLGTSEGQDVVTAFKPSGAAGTVLAQKMEQEDQRERMKEALSNAKGVDDIDFIGPTEPAISAKARKDLSSRRLKTAADLEQYRHMSADETQAEGIKENEAFDREEEAKAVKKMADAASTATGQLLIMAAGATKAGQILGAVADKFLAETAIDEERLAAATGSDAGALRGMRVMLEQANVSKGAINQTLAGGGEAQLALGDPLTAGKFISDINTKMLRARSVMPELEGFRPMNPADMIGTTAQGWVGAVMAQAEGLSPAAQQKVYQAYGLPAELGIADDITGEAITGARAFMDSTGAKQQNSGIMAGKEQVRRFEEASQTLGYEVGVTAVGGKELANRMSVEGLAATAVQGIANSIGYVTEGNLKVEHPHISTIPSHAITAPPIQPLGKSKTDLTVNNYVTVDKDGNYDTTTEVDGEIDKQFGTSTGD